MVVVSKVDISLVSGKDIEKKKVTSRILNCSWFMQQDRECFDSAIEAPLRAPGHSLHNLDARTTGVTA